MFLSETLFENLGFKMQLIYKFEKGQEKTPVILVYFVSIVKVLVIQKSISHKYLEDLSLESMKETHK